jgi:outer membrane protein
MTISQLINWAIKGINMKKIIYLSLFIFFESLMGQTILNNYIKEGLASNLALKQKEFSYNKSAAALDEARGLFFPSIGINARYSRAGGGRTIDIPVGDLVNPIYTGLNSIVGQQLYPTNIPNQSVNFLREKEHETKLSVVQPIFKPEIYFNYKIKSNLAELQQAERDAYARELVKEIKTAYYNVLKTNEVLILFNETLKLVDENLRVSNSLYKNDKVTKDVIYRAEAEKSAILESIEEAKKNYDLARFYFNFLLNKPLDTKIELASIDQSTMDNDNLDEDIFNSAIANREELFQLDAAIKASSNNKKLSTSGYYPGLVLAVDYGFQGEEYKFTKEDDFWMASLVFQWNLFNGLQDKAKSEQAEWDTKNLELQKLELQKQINLQVRDAQRQLEVSKSKLKTADDRQRSAEKSFEIVNKKFANQMASQIEFIDARTTFTQASINKTIIQYDYLIAEAALERVAAQYKF